MVLFQNVNVNQRVEVKHKGEILKGVVKFKGCLNGVRGDWVGVALNIPAGDHDGMIRGRRYFSCSSGHGIFTKASNIRFIPTSRCLFNTYHTIDPESVVEDELFNDIGPYAYELEREPVFVSRSYSDYARDRIAERSLTPDYPRSHPLRHSVSNRLPAATMLRPQTAQAVIHRKPIWLDQHGYSDLYDDSYIPRPTIPKAHMPVSALRRQVYRGWDRDHYVREMTVYDGRDPIRYNQWNDIS